MQAKPVTIEHNLKFCRIYIQLVIKEGTPDGSPFFAYFPLNTGARFSENALTPSLKSSVPKSADMAIAS